VQAEFPLRLKPGTSVTLQYVFPKPWLRDRPPAHGFELYMNCGTQYVPVSELLTNHVR